MRRLWIFASLALLCGCGDWTKIFQRMIFQDGKYLPYEENDVFPDNRAMRPLVEGTVSRERLAQLKLPHEGKVNGQYVQQIPVRITPELLKDGQKKFDIYCATCHGVLGDGDSLVARNMSLRPPPSLHDFADRPVGFFFEVMTDGFGLMPRYDSELSVTDRWAIVAYFQALHKSQNAPLAQAPDDVRRKLQEEKR